MVSAQTLLYLSWATTASYYLGTYPVKWDSTQSQFVLNYGPFITILGLRKFRIVMGKILPGLYALSQAMAISLILGVLIYVPHLTDMDKLLSLFIVVCLLMCYISQVQFLLHFEDFMALINSLIYLDDQIRKF